MVRPGEPATDRGTGLPMLWKANDVFGTGKCIDIKFLFYSARSFHTLCSLRRKQVDVLFQANSEVLIV